MDLLNNPAVTIVVQIASIISAIGTICGAAIWITKKVKKVKYSYATSEFFAQSAIFVTSIYVPIGFTPLLSLLNGFFWIVAIILFVIAVAVFEIQYATDDYPLKEHLTGIGALLILWGVICSSYLIDRGILIWLGFPWAEAMANQSNLFSWVAWLPAIAGIGLFCIQGVGLLYWFDAAGIL